MDASSRRRPSSLRTLAVAFSAIVAGLALVLAVALVWTSSRMQESADRIVRDTRALLVIQNVQQSLSAYQRLATLGGLTEEDAGTRAELERELREHLGDMEQNVGSAQEQELLDDLSARVDEYLAVHRSLAGDDLDVGGVIQRTQPAFSQAQRAALALEAWNEEEVRRDWSRAEETNRLANGIGLGSALLLVLSVVIGVIAVSRFALRPLLELKETLDRFGEGDAEARAPPGNTREITSIARTFNEMADAIESQRLERRAFLAGVAHDLRTPISAVKMAVQAMVQRPSTISPEKLKKIDSQLEGVGRMVGDLLEAARVEAGEFELHPEELDLRDVARLAIDHQAPSPTHTLELDLPADPVRVRADPLRLEQVLDNLIGNAIKYSPEGGPVCITVRARDGCAEASVSDRGVGISPEDVPHIFAPFRRVGTDRTSAPGVGLGLSVVQRLVKAHGGTVDVESKPGFGSTFRITLPLARARPAAEGLRR